MCENFLKQFSLESDVLDFFALWRYHSSICNTTIQQIKNVDPIGFHNPILVREHLIFNSVLDALSFCQVEKKWIKRSGDCAFSLINIPFEYDRIKELLFMFPNAKVITVFDNDVLGKALDCKIACLLKNKDVVIHSASEKVYFQLNNINFHISENNFSLSAFQKLAGLRSGIRTIKPKNRYVSFADILKK